MAVISILVVGVGELGTGILESLATDSRRDGARISMLLRPNSINSTDPAKRTRLERLCALGIGVEAGDFLSESGRAALGPVLRNYDVVIQAAGYGMPIGTQRAVTEAVLAAGVRHYIPWQFGADYEAIGRGSANPQFDENLDVRDLLRSQQGQGRTKWTILSTGLFMTYLFLPDFGVVDIARHMARALGSWDTRVTLTAPEDIGTMVAEAVYTPQGTENTVVRIGGDMVSYQQVADTLDEMSGDKTWEREEWDVAALKKQVKDEPDNMWVWYRNIFGAGKGISWDVEATLNAQRGIKLTDLRSFILKHNVLNLAS